jgi:hypothetical protein
MADNGNSNGNTNKQGSPNPNFRIFLQTLERVAFFLGLGWFLHEHFNDPLMESFVTPIAVLIGAVGTFLLKDRLSKKDKSDD